MWKVLFTFKAEQEIKSAIKKGNLSDGDRTVIATWIKQIQKFGPESLKRRRNYWHDHELEGEWIGYRSSAFSFKGRIIYRIENRKVIVIVVKITTDHDYSKGEE